MTLPTHEEAAKAFENDFPEYAEFIRNVIPDLNCWGDLVFRIQKEFPIDTVIGVYKLCRGNGWEEYVTKTFCPLSEKLWELYEVLLKAQENFNGLSKDEMVSKQRHIYGSIGKLRFHIMQERNLWMRANGLKSENDPGFFDAIIFYLERKKHLED
jgi:hypothetical protein